jgi:hypothetical protein
MFKCGIKEIGGWIIMPFRVDILENGEFVKREYFNNLQDAKSFQDLWNGYQRIPGVPWVALLIAGIELLREAEEKGGSS